ncbi:Transcriptional repressor PaaX [Thalassovita autumnalis]|uniref:Transcriptional repressor PaaX n=1 Tax=Thalassovita autumnalis TaxID=2072972 RepID=A0A0P1FVL2_9RHOB|nr:PaaX family transcriptional regulator C-terminal domain-containing protein [Thalassovita autumnalis]CUH69461.1 Transcriptional repressor PaaX [Thalassovita autumnalis]CUH72864.1 Transcriptional repressor PaaX [Thalassovita autumnalis]
MSLDDTPLSPLMAPLLTAGPLKVWSVAVTILGDACQTPQDFILGRGLDQLMRPLGITNQALRVALHRLKRDGWVEAEKQGRSSAYRLTQQGWASTEGVRPRIYGADVPAQPVWMALAPPDLNSAEMEDLLPADALRLSPRSAILAGQPEGLEEWVLTPMQATPPKWLYEALVPQELAQDYQTLAAACPDLMAAQALPEETQAVLRLLILHHWRRLRLRHGALPDLMLGRDWPGAEAAQRIMPLLTALPRADLNRLNAA